MKDLQPIWLPGMNAERPLIIAGPCSAETEEQVMATAVELSKNGVPIFRAGIWKPRTKPGGFEGVGAEGLEWMKRVKAETGMLFKLSAKMIFTYHTCTGYFVNGYIR